MMMRPPLSVLQCRLRRDQRAADIDVNHASSSSSVVSSKSWEWPCRRCAQDIERPKVLTAFSTEPDCLGVLRVRLDRECLSAATFNRLTRTRLRFHPCCR